MKQEIKVAKWGTPKKNIYNSHFKLQEMTGSISMYVSYYLTDCKDNVKKLSRNKVISMQGMLVIVKQIVNRMLKSYKETKFFLSRTSPKRR